MKKVLLMIMISVMTMSCFIGCKKEENTVAVSSDPSSASAESSASEADAGYAFDVNGVSLTPDMDIDTVLNKLGEPVSTFESASCAKQGMAYHYTFDNYEVETYPDGDINRVYCISLTNDMVSTPEGIDLSNSKEDVIATYGEPTETNDNSLVYKKAGSEAKLKFIFESDDTLISIEYDSKEM